MSTTLTEYRNKLEQQKGKREQIRSTITELNEQLVVLEQNRNRHEQAHKIIETVGLATQQQLSINISDIASLAMNAIYDDPYTLSVEFIKRREQIECDLTFSRGDVSNIEPMASSGGGVIDVVAFALRVASWSMQIPHSINTLILDEPFLHVKGVDANRRILELLHTISQKLNLQIIMIADERIPREDLIEHSDRAFEVTKKNGEALVTQIQ